MSKYSLNELDLKLRFKQIVGFHFVSSTTYKGIPELTKELIDCTLKQTYIGENIPKVWLDFEDEIVIKSKTRDLIEYEKIKKMAEKVGLFEKEEVAHAVRFLNDLGTVQYFEKNGLSDFFVINPQWM